MNTTKQQKKDSNGQKRRDSQSWHFIRKLVAMETSREIHANGAEGIRNIAKAIIMGEDVKLY